MGKARESRALSGVYDTSTRELPSRCLVSSSLRRGRGERGSAIASVQFADHVADAALCLAMMRATPREREWRDVVDGDGDE